MLIPHHIKKVPEKKVNDILIRDSLMSNMDEAQIKIKKSLPDAARDRGSGITKKPDVVSV